jgi:hypothetical protein
LDTGVSLIVAAWTQDLQVEQDLIISRALVANAFPARAGEDSSTV